MNCRKSEPVGHVHIELLLILFALCFVIAVLVPVTQRRSLKTDTPECFTNLRAIVSILEQDEASDHVDRDVLLEELKSGWRALTEDMGGIDHECPVVNTPYEYRLLLDTGWTVRCPDPDNHLALRNAVTSWSSSSSSVLKGWALINIFIRP